MRALVLTAGFARRLRPMTDREPKCLLPVAGEPILRRSVDHLIAAGVTELCVVTGYLREQVRAALAAWYPQLRVSFVDNPDYETTNNAYSLLLARPLVDGRSFLLLDGDIVYDRGVIDLLLARGANTLALRTTGGIGGEEVKVECAGTRVVRIGKDVPVSRAAGESIGIEYFDGDASAALFDALHDRVIARGLVNEYYEASFQQMIEAGVALHAVDYAPFWATEIDTREDLAAANARLLARKSLTDAAAG